MPVRSSMLLACLSSAMISLALAQEPQPTESPEDLEPAVDTSAPEQQSAPAEASENADAPQPPAAPEDPQPAAQPAPRAGGAIDRIELDPTQITGNRELPKVLYIVPWKRSDLGDLVGKPVNSLLDEVLMPVDRDVFRRENRYYRALMPESGASPGRTGTDSGAGAAPTGDSPRAGGPPAQTP